MFKHDSRYYNLPDAVYTTAGGQEILYKKRRFLPQGDEMTVAFEYAVKPGERLDQITARQLGNPLLFWHIADANNALNPCELTETPEEVLYIPTPASYQP
jgi:hypothetical protein